MIQPELKAYRRCSDRHVLVLETNLTESDLCRKVSDFSLCRFGS